jgi:predicted enzyme related to lactoylglutathione lyase
MNITGVDFVYLPVSDFAAASAFYADVLGLPCSSRYERVPGGEFETGTLTLQVIEAAAIGQELHPSRNPIALHVDDVPAARAELESHGVEFQGETLDTGVCRMALFNDPDGNALLLHHRYSPKS